MNDPEQFIVRERYRSTITNIGIFKSQEAIFKKEKINIVEVTVGSGQNADLEEVQMRETLIAHIPGSWAFISDSQWGTVISMLNHEEFKAKLFTVNVFNSNRDLPVNSVAHNAFIREIAFWAEYDGLRFVYAYAWLPPNEPNVNNQLTPPTTPGIPSDVLTLYLGIFLTNREDAQLNIIFDALGFVTFKHLRGFVRSVNNILPDSAGNVELKCTYSGVGVGELRFDANVLVWSTTTGIGGNLIFSDSTIVWR